MIFKQNGTRGRTWAGSVGLLAAALITGGCGSKAKETATASEANPSTAVRTEGTSAAGKSVTTPTEVRSGDVDLLQNLAVGASATNVAFLEADKAWQEFRASMRPPSPPVAWETNQPGKAVIEAFQKESGLKAEGVAEKAREFYTRYPKHEMAPEAQEREQYFLGIAAQYGNTNVLARMTLLEDAKLKDPATPEEDRLQVRVNRLQRSLMTGSETNLGSRVQMLEKEARLLMKDFPAHAELGGLLLAAATQWLELGDLEKARKLERAAGVLKADENLLRAQIELSAALTAQPASEKRVTEAKKKLTAATEALTLPAEGYTPIGKSYPEFSSGRRLALAQWIASRDNPLTARVAVNHIWLRHFGSALVPTVADFGRNGKPATHPQLLDFLAAELMEGGWSMKRLHRLILTSQSYRMRSTHDAANAKIDPDNRYLWRMNSRRMEAEAVRDSMLQVAGQLDAAMGGADIPAEKAGESRRRSIYLQHTPDLPVQFLKTFDSANPAECYERNESVVPHQALALANSDFSREQAKALAQRLADSGQRPEQFAAAAFEAILGRPPVTAELAAAVKFLRTEADREDFVHVLLNHNDFVTVR